MNNIDDKMNELRKRIMDFEVASSHIIELLDELYNNDNRIFMDAFNENYDFNMSYDDELYKHIEFLHATMLMHDIKKRKMNGGDE